MQTKQRLFSFSKRFHIINNTRAELVRSILAGFDALEDEEHIRMRIRAIRQSLFNAGTTQRLSKGEQMELIAYERGIYDTLWASRLTWTFELDGKRITGKDVPDGRWHEIDAKQTGAFSYTLPDGTYRPFTRVGTDTE